MKVLIAVFLSAFLFKPLHAQVNTNTEDIILHIEHFNFEKQFDDVSQQLYNFKGTKLVGYCKSLDVLMFRINRNIQTDDTKMFEALKNAGYLFQVKENAGIEKVQAACTDKKENNNSNNIQK
ncbi:MAG: hypothetical protein ABI723_26850 [Bacteroidia bacterium]